MQQIPSIPAGKLPPELLQEWFHLAPPLDDSVVLGPGVGLDCAVIKPNSCLLVIKSDPITFASEEIGWYTVLVNANDIATTGAIPRWMLITALFPAEKTTPELATAIYQQVQQACQAIQVTLIGGHTEITQGIQRPILIGMMLGEVQPEKLITPRGAKVGDRVLLTKGVPIEAIAILTREFASFAQQHLTPQELQQAQNYLYEPGISILKDAQIATQSGQVSAMHDATEGGLATALWELAQACGHAIHFYPQAVNISPLAQKVCTIFEIDPLAAISSGALLITAPTQDAKAIIHALNSQNIPCTEIGSIEDGEPVVWINSAHPSQQLPLPTRDELAKVFEKDSHKHR